MTKRKKMMIWILAAVLVVALLIVACDSRLLLRSYVIETEEVSDPVRLAVLMDLHSCRYGEHQRELLDMVAELTPQPDAVLLVGDIVDDELPEENAWTTIEGLSAAIPASMSPETMSGAAVRRSASARRWRTAASRCFTGRR